MIFTLLLHSPKQAKETQMANTSKYAMMFVVILLLATFGGPAFAENRWSTPVNLGEGAAPKFIHENGNLSLLFEGDKGFTQSFYQGNGQWTAPKPCGAYKGRMTAIDRNGLNHEIIHKDNDIYYSRYDNKQWSPTVRIAQKAKPLFFYIDDREEKHLIYIKYRNGKPDLTYNFQKKGEAWKTHTIARDIAYSRDWQEPGIAVSPAGTIYICCYNDLFFKHNEQADWKREKCKLDNVYMPVKLVCNALGKVHFLYYSWEEKRKDALNGFYYTVRDESGKWNISERVGKDQPSERIPAFIISRYNELIAAWEDNGGNINVSTKTLDRS